MGRENFNVVFGKSNLMNGHSIKNQAGFTLIEMMIIVGIFVIVSAMVLVNFRQGEHSSAFLLATEEVASNIRKTQTQTLTGSTEQEITASGGFGAYFDLTQPDRYVIFRDNGNQVYETANDVIIETMILPLNISIASLSNNPLTIVFKPPKPAVYLNGGLIDNSADIYLTSQRINDKQGHININRITGRITSALESL